MPPSQDEVIRSPYSQLPLLDHGEGISLSDMEVGIVDKAKDELLNGSRIDYPRSSTELGLEYLDDDVHPDKLDGFTHPDSPLTSPSIPTSEESATCAGHKAETKEEVETETWDSEDIDDDDDDDDDDANWAKRKPSILGRKSLENLRPLRSKSGEGDPHDLELQCEEHGVIKEGNPKQVKPWVIIPIWIALSASVILSNKYLFSTLNFPYPVFLTAYHMLFSTIGTQILRRTTHLLDGANLETMTKSFWSRTILPLAILFSASLILSNIAYVHLSVSFVQMMKSLTPVSTLLISFATGVTTPNYTLGFVIGMISMGCILAVRGEMNFSLLGFTCQSAAIMVESGRLVLVQILLQDLRMDPLVSIYYYAPICFLFISLCLPVLEGTSPFYALSNIGYPILFVNGLIAFCLNVAGVFLIHSAGSVVLTLSGVFKDIILVTFSILFLGSQITLLQIVGYATALTGLVLFKQTGGREFTFVSGASAKLKRRAKALRSNVDSRHIWLVTALIVTISTGVFVLLVRDVHVRPTPTQSELLIVTTNHKSPHVSLDPSVPIDVQTMAALNNYLYAKAMGADYLCMIIPNNSSLSGEFACNHAKNGPLPSSFCKLPVLHHLLTNPQHGFKQMAYIGPDTLFRYPFKPLYGHLDYLSLQMPVGFLSNDPHDLAPYTDFMVLARDDGEDARYFANATAAAFMTQWYDMPWDGREHDKQEDRVTLEVGLNLPVDGSTDPGKPRIHLTNSQNWFLSMQILDAHLSVADKLSSMIVKGKQVPNDMTRHDLFEHHWPHDLASLSDRRYLQKVIQEMDIQVAEVDIWASEMYWEAHDTRRVGS